MGLISTTGRSVFRDYVTDGVPASGAQKPVKADVRGLFDLIDTSVNAIWADVVADGVTNDRDALQTAIDAGIAQGRPVRFTGYCFLSDSLTIAGSVDFGGVFTGYGLSVAQGHGALTKGSGLIFAAGKTGIIVDTPKPVKVHDFGIFTVGAVVAGTSGVRVTDTGGYINQNSIFDNLFIVGFDFNFNFEKAAVWFMTRCTTSGGTYGARIRDTLNGDGGDSICQGNVFTGMAVSGILYESAGGLKFIGNKVNGGAIGFEMNLTSNANTGQLDIVGNSFDTCDNGIRLHRAVGTTTTYNAVQIAANFIAAFNGDGIHVDTDAVGGWLFGLSIVGNSIPLGSTNSICIRVDSAAGVTIADNILSANVSGCTGILLGSATTQASIGYNVRFGVAMSDSIAAGVIDPVSESSGGITSLVDGISAPAARSGYARIYVDSADGDLKVKFGDGTVKTIVTD